MKIERWRRTTILTLMVGGALLFVASPTYAGWLIYHKPAFEGRIVDAGTGKPLAGAIVMAVYHKRIYGIAHSDTEAIHFRETTTDNEGKFHIPPYTTMISPFSTGGNVEFWIYKKGYATIPGNVLEDVFTNKQLEDPEIPVFGLKLVAKLKPGEIALPRLNNPEDVKADASFAISAIRSAIKGTMLEKTISRGD